MSRQKFDGLVEAVRYAKSGRIDRVRAYTRRGATYSDRVVLDRPTLAGQLRSGKHFVTGVRREYWANSFIVAEDILLSSNENEVIITKGQPLKKDSLAGIPLF